MDEALVLRKCGFCHGFGVSAPKWQYEVWDCDFMHILSEIAAGSESMNALKKFLADIVALNIPCEFCEGTGETAKRIFPEKPCP